MGRALTSRSEQVPPRITIKQGVKALETKVAEGVSLDSSLEQDSVLEANVKHTVETWSDFSWRVDKDAQG